jgi:hypothetical protein
MVDQLLGLSVTTGLAKATGEALSAVSLGNRSSETRRNPLIGFPILFCLDFTLLRAGLPDYRDAIAGCDEIETGAS